MCELPAVKNIIVFALSRVSIDRKQGLYEDGVKY